MTYRTIDEIPEDRMHNLAVLIIIRDDLRALDEAISSGNEDSEKVVALNRKLVGPLLEMIKDENLLVELELTQLEVARLRTLGEMTRTVRFKFRIYVANFLRENLGI